MLNTDPKKRVEAFTKQIPELGKIPEEQRLAVFNSAFESTAYKLFLGVIVIAFVLVFYVNVDAILDYKGLERGGMIARSFHFLKALGTSFFLPLMLVLSALVLGRNYFVKKEINNYLKQHHPNF